MRGDALGRTTWVFSAGFAPSGSTGPEPEFTSRNTLCLLNTGQKQACVHLTFYYDDADPVGPYEVLVEAQRVTHQRSDRARGGAAGCCLWAGHHLRPTGGRSALHCGHPWGSTGGQSSESCAAPLISSA